MKNLFTLIALLFVCFSLFAQDPVKSDDDSGVEPVCEPFLAARYDMDAQTLTIRYESCDLDYENWGICGWGWCGTMTEEERKALEQMGKRTFMVGSLNGTVHYTENFSNFNRVPDVIQIDNLKLTTGIYFVRLKTFREGEEIAMFVKFQVH